MDTIAEGASPTRQLRRERTKASKGLEIERNQGKDSESGTEDTTEMATTAPNALRPNRTTMNPYRKAAKKTDTATNQQTKG
jgi:hypothetical protein